MIRALRPQSVVEVGAYCGFLTAWCARALEDNEQGGKVYVIDNFSLNSDPQTISNTLAALELANRVHIIEGNSRLVSWPSCELAIIDGDHSYEGCKADWERAIGSGAKCVVFHDTFSWWGPHKLISELRSVPGVDILEYPFDEGLVVAFIRDYVKPEPRYTESQYPKGHV